MSNELNLLPYERRRLITRQLVWGSIYDWLKSLVAGLLIITLAGVMSIGGLQLAIWAATRGTQAEFDTALDRYKGLRDLIAQQNISLKEMGSLSELRVVWSEIFPGVLAAIPPGVGFKSVVGIIDDKKLSLVGQAVVRSTLIVFEDRLKVLPWVKEVKFPLSNLVQRDNPTFQFDLFMKERVSPSGQP